MTATMTSAVGQLSEFAVPLSPPSRQCLSDACRCLLCDNRMSCSHPCPSSTGAWSCGQLVNDLSASQQRALRTVCGCDGSVWLSVSSVHIDRADAVCRSCSALLADLVDGESRVTSLRRKLLSLYTNSLRIRQHRSQQPQPQIAATLTSKSPSSIATAAPSLSNVVNCSKQSPTAAVVSYLPVAVDNVNTAVTTAAVVLPHCTVTAASEPVSTGSTQMLLLTDRNSDLNSPAVQLADVPAKPAAKVAIRPLTALRPATLNKSPVAVDKKCDNLDKSACTSEKRSAVKKSANSTVISNRHWCRVDGPKPFKCLICERLFVHRKSVCVHVLTHTGERAYSCDLCGARFALRSTLVQHQRTHTGVKAFSCDHCGRSFTTQAYLKHHLRVHTQKKTACCHECGKMFRDAHYLRIHLRVHSGERPFSCDQCGSRYSTLSNLYKHQRRHASTPLLCCETCGRTFRESSQLRDHCRAQHTGERPHVCQKCGRRFAVAKVLARHMLLHGDREPHLCSDCGRHFSRRETLVRHRARFHSTPLAAGNVKSDGGANTDSALTVRESSVSTLDRQIEHGVDSSVCFSAHQNHLHLSDSVLHGDSIVEVDPAPSYPLISSLQSDTQSVGVEESGDVSAISYGQLSQMLRVTSSANSDSVPLLEVVLEPSSSSSHLAPAPHSAYDQLLPSATGAHDSLVSCEQMAVQPPAVSFMSALPSYDRISQADTLASSLLPH